MNRILLAALALACACSAALAADNTIGVPYGDWIAGIVAWLVSNVLPLFLTALAAAVVSYLRKVYPWVAMILTQERVETMIQNGADYASNSVQGAMKGKKLEIKVASEFIATGTNYLLENAPTQAIKAAGGADGIAKRLFRKIYLDETATADNVLIPALKKIPAARRAA